MSDLAPWPLFVGAARRRPTGSSAAIDQAPRARQPGRRRRRDRDPGLGRARKAGLLLIHGAGAHADWWSFLAPIPAEDYRGRRLLDGGHGRLRPPRALRHRALCEEAFAVAEACGLFEAAQKPVFAAHSFGGRAVLKAAAGERAHELKAALTLDTLIRPPGLQVGGRPFGEEHVRVYPSLEATLARFRLVPPQPSDNLFIIDHLARGSIKRTVSADGTEGWGWRFDPGCGPSSTKAARPSKTWRRRGSRSA